MTEKKKTTAELAADEAGGFDTNDKNQIKNTPANIRVALRKLGKEVTFDELANRVLLNGEVIAGDEVLNDLFIKVVDEFEFEPKVRLWAATIGETARRNSFHPIKDYLAALSWDGEHRLDDWLNLYLGATDNPFSRAAGRLWMIAAVRRVRQPGVKFDEMLILEGPQGSEKSTALEVLAGGPEFFTDDLPFREDSKVFIERCTGKWIIEFSELSGINKRDVEGIKATLSRTHDRARLAYKELTTDKPRSCIFAGTTNTDEYLRDMTGNRRFWPVLTGVIDLDALRRDRDQLWAEAAHAEEAKEPIRLDPGLWA